MAAFTACLSVGRESTHVMSDTEPQGMGARTATPSSFPASWGSTRPMALAAPVLVGMSDRAAARARRRSLCGRSRMRWSFV